MSKNPVYVTPPGRALFAHLVKPNAYKPKHIHDKGRYSVIVIIDPEKYKEWVDQVNNAVTLVAEEFASSMSAGKRAPKIKPDLSPFRPHTDREGRETGDLFIRVSVRAGDLGNDGVPWTRPAPPVFDTDRRPMELSEEPGNDSIIRASFELVPYNNEGIGVTLKLRGTQLIALKQWGSRPEEDFSALTPDDVANAVGDLDSTAF